MRLDRPKQPHTATTAQLRALGYYEPLASATKRARCEIVENDRADEIARATVAWLAGGWAALDSREKLALASGELV